MNTNHQRTLRDMAKELEKTMKCNCDLDKWEPEPTTGHSFVCRIHKEIFHRWMEKRDSQEDK